MESIRPFTSYKRFLEPKFHRPILGKCQTEQSALAGNYNRFIQTSSHTYPYHVLRPRSESASQSGYSTQRKDNQAQYEPKSDFLCIYSLLLIFDKYKRTQTPSS